MLNIIFVPDFSDTLQQQKSGTGLTWLVDKITICFIFSTIELSKNLHFVASVKQASATYKDCDVKENHIHYINGITINLSIKTLLPGNENSAWC